MLAAALASTLLWSESAGKGVVRGDNGVVWADERTNREWQDI